MSLNRIFILILLLSPLQTWSGAGKGAVRQCEPDGKIIEHSDNKVVIAENSDHVGFCGAHAERDMLHQAICKFAKSSSDCFQPAVMDFVQADAEATEENGGRFDQTRLNALDRVLKKQHISDQACTPLNEFFNPDTSRTFVSYNAKFRAATESVRMKQCKLEKTSAARVCTFTDPTGELIQSSRKISADSTCEAEMKDDGRFYHYLYGAVQSRQRVLNCPQKPFPQFVMRQIPLREDLDRATVIKQLLRSGFQLQVFLKGPHSIVISNYRLICDKGQPSMQLQVLDSLYGQRTASAQKPGDWVDAYGLNVGGLGTGIINKMEPFVRWLEPAPPN